MASMVQNPYSLIKPYLQGRQEDLARKGPHGLDFDVRKAAARYLGYGGEFGDSGHGRYLQSTPELDPYISQEWDPQRTWNKLSEVQHHALARMHGYPGEFGAGGHGDWLKQQPGGIEAWRRWKNQQRSRMRITADVTPRRQAYNKLLSELAAQWGRQGGMWEVPEPATPPIANTQGTALPAPSPPVAPPQAPESQPVPLSATPAVQLPMLTNTRAIPMPEFPEEASLKYQLNELLKEGSPYLRQHREAAERAFAERGLLNSAMAASAGEFAGTEAAIPVAAADAQAALEDYISRLGYAQQLGSQEQLLAHEAALSHFNYGQTAQQAALQRGHERGLLESEYGLRGRLSAQEAEQLRRLSAQEASQQRDLQSLLSRNVLSQEGFKYSANLQGKFADHVAQIQTTARQAIAAVMSSPDIHPMIKDDMIEDIERQRDLDLQFIGSVYSDLPVWQTQFTTLQGPTPGAPIPDIGAGEETAPPPEEETSEEPPPEDTLWPFGFAGRFYGEARHFQGRRYVWRGPGMGWRHQRMDI